MGGAGVFPSRRVGVWGSRTARGAGADTRVYHRAPVMFRSAVALLEKELLGREADLNQNQVIRAVTAVVADIQAQTRK